LNLLPDVEDIVLLFTEDFASTVAPAAKKTKSESKPQVKDSRKKEKENASNCDNKAIDRRCLCAI